MRPEAAELAVLVAERAGTYRACQEEGTFAAPVILSLGRRGGDPSVAKAEARKAPTVEALCKKFMEDCFRKRNKPSAHDGYQAVMSEETWLWRK